MRLLLTLFLFSVFLSPLMANTDLRQWKTKEGKAYTAILEKWDHENGQITLAEEGGSEIVLKVDDLALNDQAWLRQWYNTFAKLYEKMEVSGGSFAQYKAHLPDELNYYVYRPSKAIPSDTILPIETPLLLLFSPSGKGIEMMARHFRAAETCGIILVTVDTFKNTGNDDYAESELLKKFKVFFPQLEQQVPHDPQKVFMGGLSGGAWRAYHYSAWVKRPWAGIYANGGWLGGEEYYGLAYPSGMRVAMVNGHLDRGVASYSTPDTELLTKAGNKVGLFSFEGGHQTAPYESQVEAIHWLLGKSTEDMDAFPVDE